MIGQMLNHYKIVAQLGQGGMGEVYVAEDTKLGRKVALKVLPAEMAEDAERRARFEREAKAVAALNHPNIITVYSVEQSDESSGSVHFITMELVEGKTLTELLGSRGLPLNRLLGHAVELTDAVTGAHRKGITHRDLKPDNVMIGDDGRLKVLDFGLAKINDPRTLGQRETVAPTQTVTQEGKILGTVFYMAPEQAEGKPADARSDVFSLGVVLYEMATGDRPFKGDTSISTITSIMRDKPTSITQLNASLPRHLARIVNRCLEKDPEQRYQTAQDLRNDLQGLHDELSSGDLEASDVAVAAAAARPRQGWLVAALGIVALAALALAAFQFLGRRGDDAADAPGSAAQNMEITRLTATGSSGEAIVSADGRYVVYMLYDKGEASMWVSQVATGSKIEIVPASEAGLWDPIFSPDGEFVYYCRYEEPGPAALHRVPALGGKPQKILSEIAGRVSFSPDGRQFVFLWYDDANAEDTLVVAGIDGSGRHTIAKVKSPSDLDDPSWSPDGKVIAASLVTYEGGVKATVVTVPAEGGELTPLAERTWLGSGELAWLPDASGLIVNASDMMHTQLWEVDYPTGRVGRITNDLNSYHGVSLTADGETLATVLNESFANLWVHTLDGSAETLRVTSGPRNDDDVNWTPDGRIVYASDVGDNLDVWIADADGSNATRLTREALNGSPRVTADSRYIVFLSNRAETVNIWRMDLDGSNPARLTTGSLEVAPSPTPDGQWVVYFEPAGGRLLRVPIDGGEPVVIRENRGGGGQVSPDGKWILTARWYADADRRQTEIIPFEGGDPVSTFYEEDTDDYGWAPDGGICFEKIDRGVGNVWCRPGEGGDALQITHAETDTIRDYAWSRDGRNLLVARGDTDVDIVLLKHFR